jgi:membrane-associated phospholipid phosphatase
VALFAGIVAISRMYRGHHFLTDVVAGAVVGASWVAIAYHLTLARHPIRRPHPVHERTKPLSSGSAWSTIP